MDVQLANEILNKLQNREISEYQITKEELFILQDVLVKREDFKHFRGEALRGGGIIYTYLEEARS